jgi:lipoate-protein ligase A
MWRLLHTPPARGAFNMALDEELMTYARDTGSWVLRVYSWIVPTLSLGRNQTARNGYDLERLAAHGIEVVRRPTGGRAILHHREVTYAVTGPTNVAGDLGESYARINRLLIAALSALGVAEAVVADSSGGASRLAERVQPGLTPCFDHPSIGEITVRGRKLVGSAQWRRDGALLQHGSILVENDQMHISTYLMQEVPAIPNPATLRDVLGRSPNDTEVAAALFSAVRTLEDADAESVSDDEFLLARADIRAAHYLDDGWTWRR